MHVILRPSSHPELEPIVATGTLFAIGRQEPAFKDLDGKLIAKLSRRHARLFEEDGSVYLADLGSLNGTTCNGTPVKHVPVPLHSGDLVEFGGLTFEAEVAEAEAPEPMAAAGEPVQRLVLTPATCADTLEPIVVSSFPFLFDKNAEPFARHKQDLRDVLAYMSRHHAHVFLRDGELFIEDLGSTNGTFVSGRKLDERARQLKDGDTIALGSDRLVYSVHLLREAEAGTTQLPSGIEAIDNPTRTIFVDSPTSFLDVYFVGDRDHGALEADSPSQNGADAGQDKATNGKAPLLVQLGRTLFDGPLFGRGVRRTLGGVLVVAIAAGGLWYWQGRELRAIEGAMARGDYQTAVTLARRSLEAHPDDPELRAVATRSAVHLWVPDWMQQVADGRIDEAATAARTAAAAVGDNVDAARMMQLLDWAARVRGLLAANPGEADIGSLMIRAGAVGDLLDWWQDDSWTHSRTLDEIGAVLPEFGDARERIYSDVRRLRSEGLDYRPLIDLDRRLEEALAVGDPARVRRLVEDFVEEHPRFADRRVLLEDVDRLQRLTERIEGERWLEAVRQLEEDPFRTPRFADHGASLASRALPDPDTLAQLDAADASWRSGDLDAAIAQLEALTTGRWRGLGQARLDRYRALARDYRALRASRGTAEYPTALFDFYGRLRESQDTFLLAELEQEFRDHAERALEQAAGYLAKAQAAWSSYRQSGGIQPEHRLAERVSSEFVAQAGRLTQAVEALRRCQRIHRQVDRPLPTAGAELADAIGRELSFQRGQVANLAFHEPEVRAKLLGLLPEAI
ncbi:MAG TPA: FHA domain-containing protein [Pseudomonadales bacterium]